MPPVFPQTSVSSDKGFPHPSKIGPAATNEQLTDRRCHTHRRCQILGLGVVTCRGRWVKTPRRQAAGHVAIVATGVVWNPSLQGESATR